MMAVWFVPTLHRCILTPAFLPLLFVCESIFPFLFLGGDFSPPHLQVSPSRTCPPLAESPFHEFFSSVPSCPPPSWRLLRWFFPSSPAVGKKVSAFMEFEFTGSLLSASQCFLPVEIYLGMPAFALAGTCWVCFFFSSICLLFRSNLLSDVAHLSLSPLSSVETSDNDICFFFGTRLTFCFLPNSHSPLPPLVTDLVHEDTRVQRSPFFHPHTPGFL